MSTLLLVVLVAIPMLASIATAMNQNGRAARGIFVVAAFLVMVASVVLSAQVWKTPEHLVVLELFRGGPGLGFSAARAPFVCLATLAFAVIALVADDRRQLDLDGSRRSAISLAAIVAASLATDLVVLTVAMAVLGAVVVVDVGSKGSRGARTDARVVGFVLAIGCVALGLAAVMTRGAGVLAPLATHAYASLDLAAVPVVARDALVLGCMVGLAAFPFSLHLPRIFARASIGPAVAVVLVQPVLVVVMHAVLPTLGSRDGTVMSVVATVSTIGAAYTALGALGQRNVRPMLGYLVASQNGLALAGLATRTIEGGVAGVLSAMATSLTGAGLLIVAHEIESRAGHVDLGTSHGYAKPWPRIGVAYLLLSLALLGFPGSLQFFSEDLLLQGFLATHPILAYGVLLVAATNGITILRSFFALFFGPSVLERAEFVPSDLSRRELLGPAILLSALVGLVALGPTIGALVER